MEDPQSIKQTLHTICDYIRWTTSLLDEQEAFFGHGTDNAWDEAAQLLLTALHLPWDINPKALDSRLTEHEKSHVINLVHQRVYNKTPTAYLTNEAIFAGISFYVDERVIIPRSPIGELINNHFQPWLGGGKPARILDLCTGSGCIGIACAMAFPDTEVVLSDISEEALAVAGINISRYGLDDRVLIAKSDLLSGIVGHFDLIISNPPYVDDEDFDQRPLEYHHEPDLALKGGLDGLLLVKRILADSAEHLTPDGLLIVELGNSAAALMDQYPSVPFEWPDFTHGGHGVFVLKAEHL